MTEAEAVFEVATVAALPTPVQRPGNPEKRSSPHWSEHAGFGWWPKLLAGLAGLVLDSAESAPLGASRRNLRLWTSCKPTQNPLQCLPTATRVPPGLTEYS